MKKFSQILTEALKIDNKLRSFFQKYGFTEYSHDYDGIGFVNKGDKKVSNKEMIKTLRKFYPKAWPSNKSGHYGPKLYVFYEDAPYSEFVITIESQDGKNVWNVYMKWRRSSD